MLMKIAETAVHAAEFDGTAIETSLTATLKITLHKKGSLPRKVSKLTFPLLENANEYIVHGFNYGVSPSSLPSASTKPAVSAQPVGEEWLYHWSHVCSPSKACTTAHHGTASGALCMRLAGVRRLSCIRSSLPWSCMLAAACQICLLKKDPVSRGLRRRAPRLQEYLKQLKKPATDVYKINNLTSAFTNTYNNTRSPCSLPLTLPGSPDNLQKQQGSWCSRMPRQRSSRECRLSTQALRVG